MEIMERDIMIDLMVTANADIRTTPIERKDKKTGETVVKQYAPVNERVKAFRFIYPAGAIRTEVMEDDGDSCTVRAEVFDEDGRILSTGWAKEEKNSSYINRTSYIENCETSAVGRALGFLGIGIDDALASTDEVSVAESKREQERIDELSRTKLGMIRGEAFGAYIEENGFNIDKILRYCNVDSLEEITEQQHKDIFDQIEKSRKKGGKK